MIAKDAPLLPCPFCGSIGVIFEDIRYVSHPEDAHLVWGAQCSNPDCIAHQSQKFYPYEEAARQAWNRRHTE